MNDQELIPLYIRFTRRQRQVVHLVSEGLSNRQIAKELFIASSVVAGHLTNIYGEIGTLEAFAHNQPNRYTLIRLFGGFIARHPEFDPFDADDSAKAM